MSITKLMPLLSDTAGIKPIRNESDYHNALKRVEALFDVPAGTPDADTLDVLATLVHEYEERTMPMRAPDPVAALEYFMECRGITPGEMEDCFGSASNVSEILNRRIPLNITMIRRLHERFGISADLLIREYSTSRQS